MKKFLLFSIVVFLFMRAGCGKKNVDTYLTRQYVIENKLNTDVRLIISDIYYLRDRREISLKSGGQYNGIWYMGTGIYTYFFNDDPVITLYVGDKRIKVWQSEGTRKTMNFPEEPYTTSFGIFDSQRWSLEGGTYYYRITSADTVLVKKPISKEQPEAATATSSGTPAS